MNLHMIRADRLDSYMETGQYVLLDIRTPSEFHDGSILGAKNYPYSEFEQWSKKLNKNTHYLIFCERGARSIEVCKKLQEMGFYAATLIGGIQAYRREEER